MTFFQLGLLVVVGFLAGIANSIAGGGSFFIYPVLLSLGVPPVSANATFSVAVLPGQASSAFGYEKFIAKLPKRYFLLLIPALIGGLIGAIFLGHTANRTFEYIVPWFMVFATILIILQPHIHKWLYTRQARELERKHRYIVFTIGFLFMFLLSIYGGYFGAGVGIVMLAFFGLTELTSINEMNGLKNLVAIVVGGISVIYFILIGLINWKFLLPLIIGSTVGGWLGATYSSKLPTKVIRGIIIAIAIIVSAVLFARQYFL